MDHIDFDVLMSYIEKEEVRNLLVSLMENPFHVYEYNEDFFNDSLMKIKECTLQDQIDQINNQIKNVQDPMIKISLASKKAGINYSKKRNQTIRKGRIKSMANENSKKFKFTSLDEAKEFLLKSKEQNCRCFSKSNS